MNEGLLTQLLDREFLMNVLLTGRSGFIGRHLAASIKNFTNYNVTGVVRRPIKETDSNVVLIPRFENLEFWSKLLRNHSVLIHCAGVAHKINKKNTGIDSELILINKVGTLTLAKMAAESGVKRFIFISSIGVNGNFNEIPFSSHDAPNPQDDYALSKWEAEKGLWQIHKETGMEIVIIRPPLVYGPGAPGNFGKLVRWVKSGIPLPLGGINNRRSFVAIDNLIDLIISCINHPLAANQVFLVSDKSDLSTTKLLECIARAAKKRLLLIPINQNLLLATAKIMGKQAVVEKLIGSLCVDITETSKLLGWKPIISVEEGLRRCFK